MCYKRHRFRATEQQCVGMGRVINGDREVLTCPRIDEGDDCVMLARE